MFRFCAGRRIRQIRAVMSNAPDIEPPVRAADDVAVRQRKIRWVVLCAALVPPVWVVVTGVLVAIDLSSSVDFPWRYHDTGTVAFGAVGLCALLTGVAGLKRGWNTAAVLSLGGKVLAVLCGLAVLMWMATTGGPRMRPSTIDKAVLNNARQLAAAAGEYFAEKGATSCALSDLVGSDRYVKALNTVDRETYPLNYTRGGTITIMGVSGARTLTYSP